jgi:hypothetical protein
VIGAGVSLVVAFVFWPRREDRPLRAALARTYESLGPAVLAAVDAVASGIAVLDTDVEQAVRFAERKARAAYVVFVDESRHLPVEPDLWDRCLSVAAQLRFGSIVVPRACRFLGTGYEDGLGALHEAATAVAGDLSEAATAIRGGCQPGSVGGALVAAERTTPAVVDALQREVEAGGSFAAVGAAIWAREWLLEAAGLTEQAVDAIGAANKGRPCPPAG